MDALAAKNVERRGVLEHHWERYLYANVHSSLWRRAQRRVRRVEHQSHDSD